MAYRVLVCDDALLMRMLIGRALSQAGYEVVGEAETGAEAIERYRELRPDLVIMDLVMPGGSGIETISELVRLDPGARVVVCSALNQKALHAQSSRAGAREFVVKPFEPVDLLNAASRALA